MKPVGLFELTTTSLPAAPQAEGKPAVRIPRIRAAVVDAARSPVDSFLAGKGTHVFDFEVRKGIDDLNFEVGE